MRRVNRAGIQQRLAAAVAAAMIVGAGAGAWAQQQPADEGAAGRLAASRLITTARGVLDEAQTLEEPHAALAERLLALAVELDPEAEHAWRLRLEAAELTGDREVQLQAIRGYLGEYGGDDAAQLRLVELLAGREATVADRLGVYQRLLERGADRLSRPLRSRLAYRAAMLRREQGRRSDYVERLKEALTLDEANPAAAAEALYFLQQRGARETEIMQALLTLLAADPGNSAVHRQIAQRLLACGQYDAAATWHGALSRLWQVSGPPGEAEVLSLVSNWTLTLWGAGEIEQAMELIDSFAESYGIEDVAELPVGLQTLRVAMLQSREEEEAAAQAFDLLLNTLEQRQTDGEQDADRLADVAWAHLLFGYELDTVEPMLQTLETMLTMDDPLMLRLRIWQAARAGDAAEARRLLEQEVDEPTAAQRQGLLMAELDQMSREQQVAALNELHASAADRMPGVWAADRLRQMGARAQVGDSCLTIGRLVQAVPAALREGAAAGDLVSLSATAVARRLDYGQPIEIDLTLTNHADVPLSLGEDGALAGTVMLLAEAQVEDEEPIALRPQFVDVARRLRIEGGRRLNLRVQLDQPDLVRLLDERPTQAVRVSVVAMLNPQLSDDGRFLPGTFGTVAEAQGMIRTRVRLDEQSVQALVDRMNGEDADTAMSAAARLVALARAAAAEGQEDLASAAVAAVERFFEEAEGPARAFVLSYVLRDRSETGPFDRLMEVARADETQAVQAMLLTGGPATGVGPDPVAMDMATARQQGAVHDLAELVLRVEDAAAEPAEQ